MSQKGHIAPPRARANVGTVASLFDQYRLPARDKGVTGTPAPSTPPAVSPVGSPRTGVDCEAGGAARRGSGESGSAAPHSDRLADLIDEIYQRGMDAPEAADFLRSQGVFASEPFELGEWSKAIIRAHPTVDSPLYRKLSGFPPAPAPMVRPAMTNAIAGPQTGRGVR